MADLTTVQALVSSIKLVWSQAQGQAVRSVNSELVKAHWSIGQKIVEAEQKGVARAGYGEKLLEQLAARLGQELGDGFSLSSLKFMRLFFQRYPELLPIRYALRNELYQPSETDWKPGTFHGGLSWTHYRGLLKVEDPLARAFYEIEAVKQGWSARQLERQIHSQLYFRLAKSHDREGLLALANEGQVIEAAVDLIKDPYVLEFLDMPARHQFTEGDLETALLDRLQSFLLELGSGFAFVGRQKRLTLEGDHFYPDLVFYHTKLKCYVILDLKVDKLTHADLGQMQLYVHYYDREVRDATDNPTVGLVLCTDKNDTMVKYVLAENQQQIFASRYQLFMPTEDQLVSELRRELAEIKTEAQ